MVEDEDCLKVFLSVFQRSVKGKSRRFQVSLKNVSRMVSFNKVYVCTAVITPTQWDGWLVVWPNTISRAAEAESVWCVANLPHYTVTFISKLEIKLVPLQNYFHQSCLRIQIHIWCKLIFNPAELGKFLGCIKTGWGVSKFFRLID